MIHAAHPGSGAARRSALEFLLLVCRRDSSVASLHTGLQRLREQGGSGALLTVTGHHGLLGLVLTRLQREGVLGAIPDSQTRLWEASLRTLRLQAAVWDLERDRILELLRRCGLGAVVLKGAALRLTTYRESVERQFGDLDLLLHPEEVNPAQEALLAAGYRPPNAAKQEAYLRHHFHLPLQSAAGFVVELHWALIQPDSPFQLDSDGFLRRARLHPRTAGPPTRVPAVEDMVLHLASQNLEDSFSRLRRLVDLDRVVAAEGGLDWRALMDEGYAGNLGNVLAHSLTLARRLLGTEVPRQIERRISLPPVTRVHIALLRPVPSVLDPAEPRRAAADGLLYLWLLSGGRARLAHLGRVLREGGDPMSWMWLGRAAPDEGRPPWRSRFARILRLAAYQLALYLAAPLGGLAELLRKGSGGRAAELPRAGEGRTKLNSQGSE